ncbi:MAG: helix-turn-helix domain-containing protein [Acidimicrobiia bacterium]
MDRFDKLLGERLRAARRHRGWSLQEVEKRSDSEFRSSVLGAYERGERAISVQRLHRLASLYRVDVAHLIPLSEDSDSEEENVSIDLDAVGGVDQDVSEVIDRFLVAIQMRRRGGSGDMTVRQADLELLAALVRSDRNTLRQVLAQLE